MAPQDPSQIDALEESADRVVSSIEKTVNAIKHVPAFESTNRKRTPVEQVDLVGILEAQGIFQLVESTITFVEERLDTKITVVGNEDVGGNQRTTVMRQILFPLLEALSTCYRLIDSIPQPFPTPNSRKKDELKPPPPRAMLSIQNYTDVGAILEFTVCTSLLPCLEPDVLTSVRDRAQYLLPKSLAGRMSRVSLLWGTAVIETIKPQCMALELKQVVATVGNVVLLDRFRPMLLPRHLADLYAGLFQTEALEPSFVPDPVIGAIYSCLLPNRRQYCPPIVVDTINQARALQTLLLRGKQGPLWLRKRVSKLLADLAIHDLFAIVQVFVVSAGSSQNDMTSAALRLAKTLAAVNDNDYYSQLSYQMLQLLDVSVESMNATEFAGALLVWACLDQIGRIQVARHFLPKLADGIFSALPSSHPHRMVRRVMVLLAVVPASHSAVAACELILSEIPKKAACLFSQILRLVSLSTVEETRIKSDALMALRMFCNVMERTTFKFRRGEVVKGIDLLSICMLDSCSPNKWDLDGYSYQIAIESGNKGSSDSIYLVRPQGQVDEASVVDYVSRRASIMVKNVISMGALNGKTDIARSFFQFLLLTIFAISQKNDAHNNTVDRRLAVMIVLPLLCETCTPEMLLLGKSSDASEILETFKLIIDCTAASLENASHKSEGSLKSEMVYGFDNARKLYLDLSPKCQSTLTHDEGGMEEALKETLMSTASIVLSLLNAILELGSAKRNPRERVILEATVASLCTLSNLTPKSRMQGHEATKVHAEMAEMASHAAALIVSRSECTEEGDTTDQRTGRSVTMLIAEAENDIQSDHPAVRAQGVVALRHLSRRYLLERGEKLPTMPIVKDLEEPITEQSGTEVLEKILRVAMRTLGDSESYVYLAGIQTIVAVADINPTKIVPEICLGVCTGQFGEATGAQTNLSLSQDERIKLSEALVFVVRRRGLAVNQYAQQILGMMMYGTHQLGRSENPVVDAKMIQEQTHDYFISDVECTNELTTQPDRVATKKLRANTGGPIFLTELNDLLRSSCIAVVAELIEGALPSTLADYATDFVNLISNVLQVEASRPLRRVAALLAVTLYEAILRELREPSHGRSLTVATTYANEESMKAALEAGMDPERTSSSQLYDPATAARCQEALSVRAQVEDTGAFAAAALYLKVQQKQDADPVVAIVKSRLDEGQETRTPLIITRQSIDR